MPRMIYDDRLTDLAYEQIVIVSEATYYRALTATSPKALRRMFSRSVRGGAKVDWVAVYERIFDEGGA